MGLVGAAPADSTRIAAKSFIGSLIGRENRSLAILARKKVVVGVRADNAPQGAGEPHRFDRDLLHRLSCIRQNRGI